MAIVLSSIIAFELGFWATVGIIFTLECCETGKPSHRQNRVPTPAKKRLLQNHALNVGIGVLEHTAEQLLPGNWAQTLQQCAIDLSRPSFAVSALRMLSFVLCVDFFFYWIHRAMHTFRLLFAHHRKHHRWVTNLHPLAALDSSKLEHCLNVSVTAVPFVLGWRLTTLEGVIIYFAIGSNVAFSHAGGMYRWIHVRHHLLHHRYLNGNFGGTILFDKIFQTEIVSDI